MMIPADAYFIEIDIKWVLIPVSLLVVLGLALWFIIRQRNMQYWLMSYLFPSSKQKGYRPLIRKLRSDYKPAEVDIPVDIYIAICDHYEPEWGSPDKATSINRVARWCKEYPAQFGSVTDSDGRPPQHSFFFPQDEYAPEYVDELAKLCKAGFGEVEIHLHHDNDTKAGLTEKLSQFRDTLFQQHGLLRKHPETGEIVYGFIHGNWALCNSRPDGRWCGVKEEIEVLLNTGCYADFTMPSAPSDTQTSTINSIYYATQQAGVKSHNKGALSEVGQPTPGNSLLMVQGPLLLDWQRRKFGIIPRIENGDLTAARPPSLERMRLWLKAGVHLPGCPQRLFVKLHTHGCKDGNIDMLLGEPMKKFHRELSKQAQQNSLFRYHYVTAWEMVQKINETRV